MRYHLFTHTDLDGIGCAILSKLAFGDDVNITYCDYNNVNDKISDFLNEDTNVDYIFITDISVNEEMSDKLDRINKSATRNLQVKLFDHHPTAKWMNKYEWAYVREKFSHSHKTSGTHLFYMYLLTEGLITQSPYLNDFVENVRRYDTWEWKTKYNDTKPKELNDLFYIIGRERFISRFLNDIDTEFYESERMLLDLENEKIRYYIDKKAKQIISKQVNGYNVGVVFAENYHSQLGNELAERFDYDFIAIVNIPYSVSYRGVNDIDLGEFAKIYGGGGHPKAAGSQLNSDMLPKLLDLIFD